MNWGAWIDRLEPVTYALSAFNLLAIPVALYFKRPGPVLLVVGVGTFVHAGAIFSGWVRERFWPRPPPRRTLGPYARRRLRNYGGWRAGAGPSPALAR